MFPSQIRKDYNFYKTKTLVGNTKPRVTGRNARKHFRMKPKTINFIAKECFLLLCALPGRTVKKLHCMKFKYCHIVFNGFGLMHQDDFLRHFLLALYQTSNS